MINSVHKSLVPAMCACAMLLAGALAEANARAGEAPGAGPDITQYLRLHDEATRVSAQSAATQTAPGEACVHRPEQPPAERREARR